MDDWFEFDKPADVAWLDADSYYDPSLSISKEIDVAELISIDDSMDPTKNLAEAIFSAEAIGSSNEFVDSPILLDPWGVVDV